MTQLREKVLKAAQQFGVESLAEEACLYIEALLKLSKSESASASSVLTRFERRFAVKSLAPSPAEVLAMFAASCVTGTSTDAGRLLAFGRDESSAYRSAGAYRQQIAKRKAAYNKLGCTLQRELFMIF